jgi:hypothetical protein
MSTMRLLIGTELSARETEQRALKTTSPLSLPSKRSKRIQTS